MKSAFFCMNFVPAFENSKGDKQTNKIPTFYVSWGHERELELASADPQALELEIPVLMMNITAESYDSA